jgi:hypothetical protein
MTSLPQIESNRRNAQKSTGPKTQNGKASSSQNAVAAGAQHLIREIVHVLQEEQASDKPRRQARLPLTGLAHRTKPVIQKLPVDQRRQPHQRVTHVDD